MADIKKERKLLGMIMLNPELLDEIESIKGTQSFELAEHDIIYDAIKKCKDNNVTTPKHLKVTDQLARDGLLDDAGGSLYVQKLTHGILYTDTAEQLAKEIFSA